MTGGFRKSASRVAIVAAAGLLIGLTPAQAADLGDDCCADLEERVAELEATTVRKGNRKVSVKLSGQVNTGVLYWDDGNENDVYVVDNTSSSSRFIISGNAKITNHLSAGFHQEIEYAAGATSSAVNQLDDDGGQDADGKIDIRKMYWWIKHKHIGRIAVGQGSPATDDLALIDLGGVGVLSVDTNLWGGSMFITRGNIDANAGKAAFTGAAGTGVAANTGDTKMSAIFTSFDSTSRSNHVRYDSPVIAGFTLSTAWGEDDIWDVALRFAGEFGGIRVAAGIGYFETTDDTTGTVPSGNTDNGDADSRFLGSISVWDAVTTGLFATGFWNYGDDGDVAQKDTERWGVRAGWRGSLTPLGHTSFFGGYQHAEVDNLKVVVGASGPACTAQGATGSCSAGADGTVAGVNAFTGNQEGTQWEVGVVQRIDAAAMELYLAYKHLDFDIRDAGTGAKANANDMDFVFGGARIKF